MLSLCFLVDCWERTTLVVGVWLLRSIFTCMCGVRVFWVACGPCNMPPMIEPMLFLSWPAACVIGLFVVSVGLGKVKSFLCGIALLIVGSSGVVFCTCVIGR